MGAAVCPSKSTRLNLETVNGAKKQTVLHTNNKLQTPLDNLLLVLLLVLGFKCCSLLRKVVDSGENLPLSNLASSYTFSQSFM